ncbi:VPLPA-CTERM sorting domain-containing protein [Marinicaulis aureus]|uniref:VPLPA-CTERM sorting domain-containing protein n=1 Tax=Hyphococcus aureus TaxID=2666033 RepID=A0ABW1KWD9_9PROT
MKSIIGLAAVAALSISSAHATTIYTTSGSSDLVSNNGSSQVYEDDGVTMTLSAGLFTDTPVTGDAVVTPGQYGARPIAYSPGTGITHNQNDGQHLVDGYFPEVAILSFDKTVQLTGALFTYVDTYDTFDLFIDSNNDGILERVFENLSMPNNSTAFVDFLSLNLVGKLFGIGTSSYSYNCRMTMHGQKCDSYSSAWKLKKLAFEEVPDVPLPAALPLFMAGLAGFGFASRKKQA